jgi:hypothetical protein
VQGVHEMTGAIGIPAKARTRILAAPCFPIRRRSHCRRAGKVRPPPDHLGRQLVRSSTRLDSSCCFAQPHRSHSRPLHGSVTGVFRNLASLRLGCGAVRNVAPPTVNEQLGIQKAEFAQVAGPSSVRSHAPWVLRFTSDESLSRAVSSMAKIGSALSHFGLTT